MSLITLGVADLERSTAFYTALGWERSGASVAGTVTFLAGGTVALALFGRDELAADAGVELRSGPAAIALATNLPSEAEVDETIARAEATGGRVTRPATRADWGGYSGYVQDPDGHLWEVAHNPGFPLDAEGRVMLPGADA